MVIYMNLQKNNKLNYRLEDEIELFFLRNLPGIEVYFLRCSRPIQRENFSGWSPGVRTESGKKPKLNLSERTDLGINFVF